ncbi:hypothetical protein E2C01_084615 [Portunus trituberculatus]|uniref:Uncharacterized protein n=1 Tax=Portunus trituberculatus TaxID=210409 RepID=A0A5B7IVU2_PORTR|nr:hypothetical protein [Portunus trituberculatus]
MTGSCGTGCGRGWGTGDLGIWGLGVLWRAGEGVG